MDEQSNPQTIDTFDGLDIRRTGGGFLSSTASLRISDGVVIFLLCSLDLQKKHPGKQVAVNFHQLPP